MEKRKFIIKVVKQIFIYLFELISISLLLTWGSTYIINCTSLWEYIERFTICYAFYQMLVIVILNNINDIEKDSCLAFTTNLKKLLLYKDTNDDKIKKEILKNIEHQLDSRIINSVEYKNAYKLLKRQLEDINNCNRSGIEKEIINAEHRYELVSLHWNYSFLLRLCK